MFARFFPRGRRVMLFSIPLFLYDTRTLPLSLSALGRSQLFCQLRGHSLSEQARMRIKTKKIGWQRKCRTVEARRLVSGTGSQRRTVSAIIGSSYRAQTCDASHAGYCIPIRALSFCVVQVSCCIFRRFNFSRR